MPESASIIFGGGFWRLTTDPARMAAQRAIFHVQREMEELIACDGRWALGHCDRGTLDGLAQVIDDRIEKIWSQHPRYFQIASSDNFLLKAQTALQLIAKQLPDCCHLMLQV